jgi:hypothetical protein
VDCHVTDGVDCQYDVTYAMEIYPNIDREIARWITADFIPSMNAHMTASGHLLAPYIIPREDRDLSKGFIAGPATPRFSTGYAALQNRPSLLIETHMLKPYKTRVEGTYEMLIAVLNMVNSHSVRLQTLVHESDKRSSCLAAAGSFLPMKFETTDSSRPVLFKGIEMRTEWSEISGSQRRIYTGTPIDIQARYSDQARIVDSVRIPHAYIFPPEWSNIASLLRLHGAEVSTLESDSAVRVHRYRLSQPHWQERPYEGRHSVTFNQEEIENTVRYPAGSFLVRTNQRTARVIVNLLEPKAPDSFVSWGFFDAIFEQKEYGEDYVLEKLAREMSEARPEVKRDFDKKVTGDSSFAKDAYGRLNYFYQRSPYWDAGYGIYPVARTIEK